MAMLADACVVLDRHSTECTKREAVFISFAATASFLACVLHRFAPTLLVLLVVQLFCLGVLFGVMLWGLTSLLLFLPAKKFPKLTVCTGHCYVGALTPLHTFVQVFCIYCVIVCLSLALWPNSIFDTLGSWRRSCSRATPPVLLPTRTAHVGLPNSCMPPTVHYPR